MGACWGCEREGGFDGERWANKWVVCDRFFWLALYAQPGLWVGLAIFALVRLESPIWLSLNGKGTLCCGWMLVAGFLLTRFWNCSYCVGPYDHKHTCFLAVR